MRLVTWCAAALVVGSLSCRTGAELTELSPARSAVERQRGDKSPPLDGTKGAETSIQDRQQLAAPEPAAAPPALACFVRYYGGRAELDEEIWWWRTSDGARVLYDDRKAKTFEERLAAPDVEDVFSIPYPTVTIAPVTEANYDPGRIRLDIALSGVYGRSASAVRSRLVPVKIAGQRILVHDKVAGAFERVAKELAGHLKAHPQDAKYFKRLGGTFNWRKIEGTDRQSAHSYGISLDLDTRYADHWRWGGRPPVWKNRIPEAIVALFEAEGFIWGGRWYHFDTMHFEYRPELLDPHCR